MTTRTLHATAPLTALRLVASIPFWGLLVLLLILCRGVAWVAGWIEGGDA